MRDAEFNALAEFGDAIGMKQRTIYDADGQPKMIETTLIKKVIVTQENNRGQYMETLTQQAFNLLEPREVSEKLDDLASPSSQSNG